MLCDLFVMKCNMMMETDCIFFIHILHVLKMKTIEKNLCRHIERVDKKSYVGEFCEEVRVESGWCCPPPCFFICVFVFAFHRGSKGGVRLIGEHTGRCFPASCLPKSLRSGGRVVHWVDKGPLSRLSSTIQPTRCWCGNISFTIFLKCQQCEGKAWASDDCPF